MAFRGKNCKAVSKITGKPCSQPAMSGSDYCRIHKNEFSTEESGEEIPEAQAGFDHRNKGAQQGNVNAVKHGAYSMQLLPEEESVYQEMNKVFIQQLGEVDAFDNHVVHFLSLLSAKVNISASRGAPAEALIPVVREVIRLIRSLKETRDTRDPVQSDGPKTSADFLEELNELAQQSGIFQSKENERRRIYKLEKEVNDLRKKLKLPPREDIDHKIDSCSHCHNEGEHRKNVQGDWICMACGWVIPLKVTKVQEILS